MPVYTFENDAGETVDLVLPVASRHHGPRGFRRVIAAGAPFVPKATPTQRDEVLNGFRQVEAQIGTSELTRKMDGLKPAAIKRIWENSTP